MAMLLWQFSYLQLLDVLTTVAFLMVGVQEGNPLVRLALNVAPNPFIGLGLVKLAGMALGLSCAVRGRHQLLGRINMLFAAVVVWNMAALIIGVMRQAV
jgi:hypothetical protein